MKAVVLGGDAIASRKKVIGEAGDREERLEGGIEVAAYIAGRVEIRRCELNLSYMQSKIESKDNSFQQRYAFTYQVLPRLRSPVATLFLARSAALSIPDALRRPLLRPKKSWRFSRSRPTWPQLSRLVLST